MVDFATPDVAQLRSAGPNPEMARETGPRANTASEGVTGLKSLGVRELNYKLCFLACAVHLADKDGWSHFVDDEGTLLLSLLALLVQKYQY